jgi:hypothetical protein
MTSSRTAMLIYIAAQFRGNTSWLLISNSLISLISNSNLEPFSNSTLLQQKSLFKLKLKNILFHIQTAKRLKQHIDKVFAKAPGHTGKLESRWWWGRGNLHRERSVSISIHRL